MPQQASFVKELVGVRNGLAGTVDKDFREGTGFGCKRHGQILASRFARPWPGQAAPQFSSESRSKLHSVRM